MSLIKQIQADYLAARYAKETLKTNLLSTLLGEAQTIGKDAGNRDATNDETITVIKKFIKNAEATTQAALASAQINMMHKVQTAANEIEILYAYLPPQLDIEKVEALTRAFVAENTATTLGGVMAFFKAEYAGQYDGKTLSTVAKEMLNERYPTS